MILRSYHTLIFLLCGSQHRHGQVFDVAENSGRHTKALTSVPIDKGGDFGSEDLVHRTPILAKDLIGIASSDETLTASTGTHGLFYSQEVVHGTGSTIRISKPINQRELGDRSGERTTDKNLKLEC